MIREPKTACAAKFIEAQIKSNNVEEFLSIFAPLTSALMLLSAAYGGASPKDLMQMLTANSKNVSSQLKRRTIYRNCNITFRRAQDRARRWAKTRRRRSISFRNIDRKSVV